MNSNPTSKFLFYNFNTFRSLHGKNIFTIRHSIVANDEYALEILQNRSWFHFIKNLIYISNNDLSFDLFQEENTEENSLIDKTFENLNYCKSFYENVFDDIAYFFHRKLKETPNTFIEKMEEDLARELFYYEKIKEQENSADVLQKFNQFFFKTGRFPDTNDLAIVPFGVMPSFVKTKDIISPFDLYKNVQDRAAYGLVSTQFLAALNINFGSDKTVSRNAMTEFFHNLSLQALNKNDYRIWLQFDAIIRLNRELKRLIRDDGRNTLNFVDFKLQVFKRIKEPTQLIEEVVNNIISGTQVDYLQDDYISFANTASEIAAENNINSEIEEKATHALTVRDKEISEDIIIYLAKDLINSVFDTDGEIAADVLNNTLTNIETDENRINENLKDHVKNTIKKDNQQFLTATKTS